MENKSAFKSWFIAEVVSFLYNMHLDLEETNKIEWWYEMLYIVYILLLSLSLCDEKLLFGRLCISSRVLSKYVILGLLKGFLLLETILW